MKLSKGYIRMLETYLEWENVKTPASGSFQELVKPKPNIDVSSDGFPAGEALCVWESTGNPCSVLPDGKDLIDRYILGKNQRDWWSREIGWWNKNGSYVPEEFLKMLGPLPFIELFYRSPATRLVRYYYDNRYALWEFKLDIMMESMVSKWNMGYYERDDRHSAIQNAWRMILVKWVSPFIYREEGI